MVVTVQALRAEVVRPSTLGASERAQWHEMQAQSPSLQRAFLSLTFAQACERANGRAYVAVLHDAGAIRGFFPFQFRSMWHQRLRLAERIGGGLSDAAGLIASPDLRISAPLLLRQAGISALSITHLMAGQELLGLDAEWSEVGHITDIREGPDAYFAALLERERAWVRDTERQLRKAEASYGDLRFTSTELASSDMIAELITQKRQQYQRTQAGDAFAPSANVRLISALNETPAPDCRLVMSRLGASDRVLAQHLGPQYHDVLSFWFPVYDPEAGNVSPGRLLLWQMIRHASESGIGLIDYGAGDAVYKRKFATTATRYGNADWFSGDVRSVIAHTYQGLEWRLRWHYRRMRNQASAGG
jgi:CelD/BcsL family acetyltransferase involved in cellulose biosynthesis